MGGADGIALVYDVTDPASFMHIDEWFDEVNRNSNQSIAKILIGNKCDLESERKISTNEGKKKAEELGMIFMETSAKSATNVDATFQTMSVELIKNRDKQGTPSQGPRGNVGLLTPKNPSQSKGAC